MPNLVEHNQYEGKPYLPKQITNLKIQRKKKKEKITTEKDTSNRELAESLILQGLQSPVSPEGMATH